MLDYYRFKAVSDRFMQGKTEEARLELAELQRRYVALCSENIAFKMQMQEYEDILYLARNLILEDQFYWLITGHIRQGPFCPHCYNKDGLLMRLSGDSDERHCTTCRESFLTASRQLDPAIVVSQDFMVDSAAAPTLKRLQCKAKVIPFGR